MVLVVTGRGFEPVSKILIFGELLAELKSLVNQEVY